MRARYWSVSGPRELVTGTTWCARVTGPSVRGSYGAGRRGRRCGDGSRSPRSATVAGSPRSPQIRHLRLGASRSLLCMYARTRLSWRRPVPLSAPASCRSSSARSSRSTTHGPPWRVPLPGLEAPRCSACDLADDLEAVRPADRTASRRNHRCGLRYARTSRRSWSVCMAGTTRPDGERNAAVP